MCSAQRACCPRRPPKQPPLQTADGGAETSRRPPHEEGVMTVQPDGQQPDGRKLGGGAIASLTGVGSCWSLFPEHRQGQIPVPVLDLHLAAVVVHHHDGGLWGAGVVRVGRDASSPAPGGTPPSPVVLVGLLVERMDGGLAHERSPAGGAVSPSCQPQGRLPRCRLATLTRGSCLAVDRQDRLEASPLIPAGWSPALGFPSDRTVARGHCRSGPGGPGRTPASGAPRDPAGSPRQAMLPTQPAGCSVRAPDHGTQRPRRTP
jgi:hypothetical protein